MLTRRLTKRLVNTTTINASALCKGFPAAARQTAPKQPFATETVDEAKYSYLKGESVQPNVNTIGYHLSSHTRNLPFANSMRSVHQRSSLTHSAVKRHVEALACGLLDLGLRPGDNLGLIQGTTTDHFITMLAAGKLGATLVEIPALKTAKEVSRAVELFRPRVFIVPPKLGKVDYYKMLSTEIFPELKRRQTLGDFTLPFKSKQFPFCKQILVSSPDVERNTSQVLSLKDVLLYGPFGYYENPLRRVAMNLDPQHSALIVMDGNDINKARPVVFSHQNLLSAGQFLSKEIGAKQNDRIMVSNMQDSVFGAVLGNYTAFSVSATVVYPSEEWNVEETLKSLQQEQCTVLFAKGTEMEELIGFKDFAKYKYDTLKTVVVDSSASLETVNKIKAAFKIDKVVRTFGPEDVTSMLLLNNKIAPNSELKITRKKDGKIVHRETPGDLKVRSPLVAKGIWSDAGLVKHDVDEDGWFTTGKLATLDAEGQLKLQ